MSNTPQQVINVGETINDGTGESLRASFNAVNNNFANVWAAGPVDTQVVISGNKVSTNETNLALELAGNGIGNINVASTILPTVAGVYDVGSASLPFDEIHARYFYGNGRYLTGISGGGGSGSNVTFSIAAPLNPNVGDIWIQSTSGVQYLYFSDGTGSQWAEMEAYQSFSNTADFGNVVGNIIPSLDSTYTLGNATNQWASLWVANSTIYIGGIPLAIDSSNNLTVNGSPVVAVIGNTANIGNFVFNENALENLNGLSFDNGDLAHGWTARLALPANGMTNPALFQNTYGNISIGVGATASITSSWTFGSDGNLTLPSGTPSINYANGQPYISGGGGNGTPGGSNTQIQFNDNNSFGGSANLVYDKVTKTLTTDNINVGNLYFGGTGAVNIESGNDLNLVSVGPVAVEVGGTETWTFDTYGSMTAPGAINVGNMSIGELPGYITAEANTGIILNVSGPDGGFVVDYLKEDGNANTSGGELAFNSELGNATYRISLSDDLGDGFATKIWRFDGTGNLNYPDGTISTGGQTYAAPGSSVQLISNNEYNQVRVDNSNVEIYTSPNGVSQYQWTFDTAGNLTLPGNTFSVNYANGTPVSLGGGGYGNANVAANLAAFGSNPVSTTGNISGSYILGNGSQLSAVNANTVDVLNTNGLTTTFYPTFVENRDSAEIVRADVDLTYRTDTNTLGVGNLTVTGLITATGNISGGNIRTGGNVDATSAFVNAGAVIASGRVEAGTSMSAAGNVTAGNILTGGLISSAGNITAANLGNVSALNLNGNASQVLYGNGVFAEVAGGSSYGNANVAANLAAFGSNPISTSGNVTAANFIGNISITGNVTGTSSNVTLVAGSYSTTFDNAGNVTLANSNVFVGTTNSILPNTVASFSSNINSYTQVTNQNKSTGADATADYVLTADNGSDSVNYGDFGIINSGYDNATPTNSLGNIVFAADTYVYATGNVSNTAQSGGNLVIGTTTTAKTVKIFAGGNTSSALVANISNTGVAVTGVVSATGNIDAGNIRTVGIVSATANITTSGYFISGNQAAGGFQLGNVNSRIQVGGGNSYMTFGTNPAIYPDTAAAATAGLLIGGSGYLLAPNGARALTLGSDSNVAVTGSLNLPNGGQVSTTGNVTAGNITSIASITRSGTLAQPSWTTNGIGLKLPAATYNETTAPGGTVAAQYIHNMGAPTLIASNATTYTNYATLFVAQPTPSTNVTVTNNYAIMASGNVSVSGNVVGGNLSVTGNITGNTAGYSIGYRDIPQVTFSANATAALSDAGKHYYSTTAGNLSLTLPDNSTTAFPTGTSMTIVVQATGNVLVNAAAGVTLYLGGSSTSGNRVVGAYGMASVLKVAANVWFINGTGVY